MRRFGARSVSEATGKHVTVVVGQKVVASLTGGASRGGVEDVAGVNAAVACRIVEASLGIGAICIDLALASARCRASTGRAGSARTTAAVGAARLARTIGRARFHAFAIGVAAVKASHAGAARAAATVGAAAAPGAVRFARILRAGVGVSIRVAGVARRIVGAAGVEIVALERILSAPSVDVVHPRSHARRRRTGEHR